MFLFPWRLALRSLFSPALLRGVKNLPHDYSGTLLTWGKNKLIMLKVSQRWKGSVTILSKSIKPIKLLSKAKISLLPFCYRRSPLRRQMRQMIAAVDCFVWVAFWCNYMASFLWKAVGHEKNYSLFGEEVIDNFALRFSSIVVIAARIFQSDFPSLKNDNMLAFRKVFICAKRSEKVHSISPILNLN